MRGHARGKELGKKLRLFRRLQYVMHPQTFLGDKRKTSDGDLLAFSSLFRCLARSCSQRQSVTRANVSGPRGIVCNFKIKLVPARSKSPSFNFLKKKSRMGICFSNALIYTIYRVT